MKTETNKLIRELSELIVSETYENYGLMHNGKLLDEVSGVVYLDDLENIQTRLTQCVLNLIKCKKVFKI